MKLGDKELIRVFAKHPPYIDGHYEEVRAIMMEIGPPTITVVEWRGDLYAIEGSHRLASAHELGMVPTFIVTHPDRFGPEDEAFWEGIRGRLPQYAWCKI